MCLTKVTDIPAVPDRKVRRGYKIVELHMVIPGKIHYFVNPFFRIGDKDELDFGVWHNSGDGMLSSDRDERYENGFHIFKTIKDAKRSILWKYSRQNYYIIQVEYSNVVCVGTEDDSVVVVAKKIKYLPNYIDSAVPRSQSPIPLIRKGDRV